MPAVINNVQVNGQPWIAIETPYNFEFVKDLKSAIHYTDRRWNSDAKLWMVTNAEADNAIAVIKEYFEILDHRGLSQDDADENVLQSEIEKIKAGQAYIVEQKEHINDAIRELDIAINRYSYTSKSTVKGRMCRDRALLQHALSNAQKLVEHLVEMEISGLSAAVRLIGENSIQNLIAR